MKSPLLGKFLLIAVIVAGAFAFGFPPKERISLGLDLRGGAHILMQVLTETALESQIELTQSWLGNSLKDEGIAYDSILSRGAGTLEIRGTDPARSAKNAPATSGRNRTGPRSRTMGARSVRISCVKRCSSRAAPSGHTMIPPTSS